MKSELGVDKFHRMIGRRIMRFRELSNLTTTELAKRVGISQAQISRLENAKQGFRSATLQKIADDLSVSVLAFVLPEECEILSDKKDKREREKEVLFALHTLAKSMENPSFVQKMYQDIHPSSR